MENEGDIRNFIHSVRFTYPRLFLRKIWRSGLL